LHILMHQAGIDASSRYWCIKQVLMHHYFFFIYRESG
jgi:hypothetical protein